MQITRMPKLSLIQNACYRIVIVVLKTPFSYKLNGSFHYPDAGQRTRGETPRRGTASASSCTTSLSYVNPFKELFLHSPGKPGGPGEHRSRKRVQK